MRLQPVTDDSAAPNNRFKLPPELELLLCCARTRLAAEAEQIQTLATAGLDWDAVIRAAARHNIQPLLFWHLKTNCANTTPPAVLSQLEKAFHGNAWLNLHLSREVINIVRLLQADGIRVISFKGVTLAAPIYGSLSLRHAGDIDILVAPAEAQRAKQLLLNAGFKTTPMSAAVEAAYLQTANHFYLARASTRAPVELHWQITPQSYRPGTDFEALWRRSRPITLLDERVPGLSPEDLLSFLCFHLLKHPWPSLRWLADVAELLHLHQLTLDWPALLARPPIGGSRRMFELGLFLAHHLLDAPLPGPVAGQLAANPVLPALAGHICHRLFHRQNQSALADWQHYRFQLNLLGNLRDRLRYIYYMITPYNTTPGHLLLPRWLFPLYYVIRPVRFLMQVSRSPSSAGKSQ